MQISLAVGLVGVFFSALAAAAAETGPSTVIEAEYAFAKSAKPLGVRGAFLKYLATDSIICSPGPVNGIVSTEAGEPNADTLEWYPALSHTAASADLGYTTGPWTYRTADGKTEVNGTFLSVWRKQPDGSWRVVVDCGVNHPKPAALPTGLAIPAAPATIAAKTSGAQATGSWIDPVANADVQFAASATNNPTTALGDFSAPDVHVLTRGVAPAIGVKSGQAVIDATSKKLGTTWRHVFASESADGTLGYTWGYIGDPKSEKPAGAYVNVWQKERSGAPWKIVAQALQVLPQK
jgi:ketosteroid isomerase-like protein